MKPPFILILDFGSQFTQLIARRVRECSVYCEIHPYNRVTPDLLADPQLKGIILSGGPSSVLDGQAPRLPEGVLGRGVPILGVCYGMQALCVALGGRVESPTHREFGRAFVDVVGPCALFEGVWALGSSHQVWMSHGDRVVAIPEGFSHVASSEGASFAAICDEARRLYGVQFHPEVVHTPDGLSLYRRFVHDICGCGAEWTMDSFRRTQLAQIAQTVGDQRVICGLSGGVDSAVTAVLIHEAIGDQLTCIFVDHGLLRDGEAEEVVSLFRAYYKISLVHVDARDRFFSALSGVEDPEVKRKTIGRLFVEVFEEEAKKIGGATFLAQGTLYPDVVESVSSFGGPSVTIKSHHNVGGLPERMAMSLLEPLRELFKDEVRSLGRELGLPEAFVGRHPFPGPGLAIRVLGEVTAEKVAIARKADAIFIQEIRKEGLYDAIWQAFCVLLPVRTVGVMGDGRTYDHVLSLRAVVSVDGMTADWFAFDPDFLRRVSVRIVNEVEGVNRVVYDVTSKPPGTIEWE